MKPFLTTNRGVLYKGDCLELLSEMKDECVDTIFADPPFNIGKDYKNGYDDIVFDPFGGGGSTYQAAQKLNRNWIGVELYDCHHIKKRLFEEFGMFLGKTPLFEYDELFDTVEV